MKKEKLNERKPKTNKRKPYVAPVTPQVRRQEGSCASDRLQLRNPSWVSSKGETPHRQTRTQKDKRVTKNAGRGYSPPPFLKQR